MLLQGTWLRWTIPREFVVGGAFEISKDIHQAENSHSIFKLLTH